MKQNEIIYALQWRYATKKFDTTKKVSKEDLDLILEAGRLAPSSLGLQPWKFIVVQNETLRTKLRAVSMGQSKVTDASHLIVLAHKKTIEAKYIDEYIQAVSATRGIPIKNLDFLKRMQTLSTLLQRVFSWLPLNGGRGIEAWCARQSCIALGMMIETAALLKVDACPMEGFKPKLVDELLGLREQGYRSVVLLALGYRASDDTDAKLAKVRRPAKEVIEYKN